jgi:DNA invertase Pin-like site-specific DNA recombinase
MADAHRRFAVLLVWKIDHYGQSLRHLVMHSPTSTPPAFVSVRDNLDLSTPSGRLMFQVVGAMAEFEWALTQERVRAGLRLARSKGKKLGRPGAAVKPEQVNAMRAERRAERSINCACPLWTALTPLVKARA